MKIVIVGNGFVGNATASIRSKEIDVLIYDIDIKKCVPETIVFDDLLADDIDVIFICLPTPYKPDTGECVTEILDKFIANLIEKKPDIVKKIIVRSTIPITFCEKYNVSHMPEFLTEKNPIETFRSTNVWIVGLAEDNLYLKEKINNLIEKAYENEKIISNNLHFCSPRESALIKLGRNAFLAMKVSFFNEIYDIAEAYNIDYNIVSNGIGCDARIGNSHTKVPGHDGFRGFGGICFPKDLNNLITSARENKINPIILEAVANRNTIDRPLNAKTIDHVVGRSV